MPSETRTKKLAKLLMMRRLLFNILLLLTYLQTVCNNQVEAQQRATRRQQQQQQLRDNKPPSAIQSASYVSLDGLSLIVTFDKPVNLSVAIESVEQRLAAASAAGTAATSGDYDEAGTGQDGNAGQEQTQRRPNLIAAPSQRNSIKKKRTVVNFVETSSKGRREKVVSSNKLQASASNQDENASPNWTPASLADSGGGPPTCPASGRGNPQSADVDSTSRKTATTPYLVEGIQLCAQVLSQKTLKRLRKFQLRNCVWPTQVQFLIQLGKPISAPAASAQDQNNAAAAAALQQAPQLPASLIRVAFKKGTISSLNAAAGRTGGGGGAASNERELAVELGKLPLEGLGVALAPKLALTGPNRVPPCGQFSLSALLSSPFGTRSNESLKLSWSIERVGLIKLQGHNQPGDQSSGGGGAQSNSSSSSAPSSQPNAHTTSDTSSTSTSNREQQEQRWLELQEFVRGQTSNNLVLDSQMFEFVPQLYEVRVTANFVTSMASFTLNSKHQFGRLDYEAPLGTIYGSHLLSNEQQVNTNRDLILLADVQVPECAASSIKQVGVYWQVSEQRVRFEQTYAPYYLARANSLPEQALIEFRLNLFYGIRVKKVSSTSAFVLTGDSLLESKINDGLLVASVFASSESNAANTGRQLELYATGDGEPHEQRHASYVWSCFDGKTAQTCVRNGATQNSTAALVDKSRQRAQVLRLPVDWLESGAQLWFGLQRLDSHQMAAKDTLSPSPAQQPKSEFALVSVQPVPLALAGSGSPLPPALLSIGPILLGRSRQRAFVRNPLTGSILLVAGAPVVIVGRLTSTSGADDLQQTAHSQQPQLTWHLANYVQPLNWLVRNETNRLTGRRELVSELHLGADVMVAHAHHQVQLSACLSGYTTISASVNIDVVQGVSECRVEPIGAAAGKGQRKVAAIAVNSCNIPLGLAPLTYQLYLVDTSATDSLVDHSTSRASPLVDADEDTNEADELYFATQSQPLSAAQLSAVFAFGAQNSAALNALLAADSPQPQTDNSSAQKQKVRFGARVCDRLQVCRMFYSGPLDLASLSAATSSLQDSRQAAPLWAANQAQQVAARRRTLHFGQLVESARKTNLAGNSIAAISILNAVINSIGSRLFPQNQILENNGQQVSNQIEEDNKLRELLQVAVRDCLRFVSQSMQRPLQYTESGQTNLVLSTLANILALPQSGKGAIESKFLALRLVDQLNRRSIEGGANELGGGGSPTLATLADFRTIQSAFESVFSSFSLHSTSGGSGRPRPRVAHRGGNETTPPPPPAPQNRRKREEAVLAYLRAARHAHKSLLQSAAVQLGLGAVHQFEFQTNAAATVAADLGADSNGKLSSAGAADIVSSLTHQTTLLSDTIDVDLHEFGAVSVSFGSATSSQQQQQEPIKEKQAKSLGAKLSQQLGGPQLRCKNSTTAASATRREKNNSAPELQQTTKCSSFVLALTSFAGKAPFRSLDSTTTGDGEAAETTSGAARNHLLRVPVLQIDWLSPIDGSDLIELLRADAETLQDSPAQLQRQQQLLKLSDFEATVVFTVPAAGSEEEEQAGGESVATTANSKPFKCYQFDEQLNEWTPIETIAQPPQASGLEQSANGTAAPPSGTQQIRCKFSGFGVVSAFQGEPPAQFGSLTAELSLALKVGGVFAIVALISLICCIASNSKSTASRGKNSRNSSASLSQSSRGSPGSTSTSSCDESAAASAPLSRHLQPAPASTTYRNDFH